MDDAFGESTGCGIDGCRLSLPRRGWDEFAGKRGSDRHRNGPGCQSRRGSAKKICRAVFVTRQWGSAAVRQCGSIVRRIREQACQRDRETDPAFDRATPPYLRPGRRSGIEGLRAASSNRRRARYTAWRLPRAGTSRKFVKASLPLAPYVYWMRHQAGYPSDPI